MTPVVRHFITISENRLRAEDFVTPRHIAPLWAIVRKITKRSCNAPLQRKKKQHVPPMKTALETHTTVTQTKAFVQPIPAVTTSMTQTAGDVSLATQAQATSA